VAERGEQRGDPVRLLAARSEHGYTHRVREALRDEPEAVPASYQRQLSERARLKHQREQQAAWRECSTTIVGALATFQDSCGRLSPSVTSSLRAIRRQAVRLDQQLSG
jgi:hypothetical protein